ncbi:MAG TPA: endonuclease/exonuclease/phosphatase family protein, partial [Acidimicrobiia bacterium]|nr:endonuclease/exonuclease/phosphatase family protein [Acidimicrobiia bacterium]
MAALNDQVSASAAKAARRLARRQAALAARPGMSPKQPAPEALRVATWNVNSLRRRVEPLDRFLERVSPDVLCLQETKATTIDAEATAVFHARGYRVV